MKRTLYSLLLTLLVAISGLQTAQAGRMYDPEVSRFLSIDPALHEQMPQQLLANHPRLLSDSPYSYGYNNPLRFTDPDGKTPWDLLDIAFAVMSVKDAIQDPSTSNIFWASVDVLAAAAPIIPSSRGARMALNAIEAVDDVTDAVKATSNVVDNAKQGKKFEGVVTDFLKQAGDKNVAEQVTIKPNGGGKNVRVDNISTQNGKIKLTDAKSSAKAPHTKNQKNGYPAIELNGGTVVGNKGRDLGYPAGTKIPPTKVDIIRPNDIK